ncbi:MAG: DegT/DnrJ/EryC1/StrS family aminotransferase [Thioalkalispiraceae bacterium]|jgi:dTDP-4-amino-4,6-dideoxygalactose transaminase
MIPMVDLKAQYHNLKAEIDSALLEVLENTQFILGPNVQEFEKEAAENLGVKHALSCASGTDALHLALLAAGIGKGDEVITSTFTFIATAEAIRYVGAIPVFVDIDPKTYNLDPDLIEHAINDKTRAILPVHIFGQPADMDAIMSIASRHDLLVIEDCAQSYGARIKEQVTGGIGLAGCHSFFPSKNLGCYGDGGMVTTNDDHVAEQIRIYRNHGSSQRYHHDVIGYNSRLDELQAAILRIKLRNIDQYNQSRYAAAQKYSEALKDVVTPPFEDKIGNHVYHQYTLLSPERDNIMRELQAAEIACAVYYPIPLHKQNVFVNEYIDISLPVAERIASECISLPIFPEITDQQIELITSTIKSVF